MKLLYITTLILLSSCATYTVTSKSNCSHNYRYEYTIVNETDTVIMQSDKEYRANEKVKVIRF